MPLPVPVGETFCTSSVLKGCRIVRVAGTGSATEEVGNTAGLGGVDPRFVRQSVHHIEVDFARGFAAVVAFFDDLVATIDNRLSSVPMYNPVLSDCCS